MASGLPIEKTLQSSATAALAALGKNLEIACKRRRIQRADLADRAMISQPTLRAVFKGDPRTSIGAYAAVMAALSLQEDLRKVADPEDDELGKALAEQALPKRIKIKESQYDF